VEWSLNIESEVFVELSLLWFTLVFIDIDNIPKLVSLSVASADDNVLVLGILVLVNLH
jgi:uncharacterized membrane protein